ncbi:hypothetical protein [Chamaesiphon polymorphus]|uniref:Uncharacterized protein n=1 Tax=Chamaesiphon polymorphus CCALA 037 TaxID=2107692 RepID=A0A2T1GBJ8_9CYAN|nr:hypothetical protein [Chamaesiphon polymorphus]PSB54590.1 hypothetical protein C7B77_17720 [Chamaesiphon polymorphus CCALA 037]
MNLGLRAKVRFNGLNSTWQVTTRENNYRRQSSFPVTINRDLAIGCATKTGRSEYSFLVTCQVVTKTEFQLSSDNFCHKREIPFQRGCRLH